MTPSQFDALTQINLDDLVTSFGWQNRPFLARLLRRLFAGPARAFAHQMMEFDSAVGSRGLVEASRLTIRNYVLDLRVLGADRLPASAFLALSNHPGMSDTLAAFTALNRPDLKIIALDRPFLNALPSVEKHLFYVRDDPASRMALVRQVSAHLRNGGAALTFPAGHIEPDPDVHDGAVESLQSWTDSVGVFIRLAPRTAILPILVRGVVWKKAARHFLLNLKKTGDEKEKLAAALQLLVVISRNLRPTTVHVTIANPITLDEVGSTETSVIHQVVLERMRALIENPPEGEGISVL